MQHQHDKNDPKHPAETPPKHHFEDDVVVVPKGASKLRFFLLLGLTILVLLIFTVGDQIMQSVSGRVSGPEETFMVWNDPEHGTQSLTWNAFNKERVHLEDFYRVQGMQQRTRELTGDDDVAFLIVTDRLARHAGIEVTNTELAKALLEGEPGVLQQGFMNGEIYKMQLQQWSVSAPAFEATLAQMLRVTRYFQLMRAGAGAPEPAEIERLWKESHKEYAFDYANVAVADFQAEAEKAVPADAELDDWYQKLPRRMQVFAELVVPEKRSGVLVGVRATGEDLGAGLLAKYPAAPGTDAEAQARTYYENVRDRRFRRPEPLTEEAAVDMPTRLYLPYEDVADAARREAPLQTALQQLLLDLQKRANGGEKVDLATEAKDLGLWMSVDEALRTQEEWSKAGGPAGAFLAQAILRVGPNNLVDTVVVDKDGFAIASVKERAPQSLPPLADVRDKVVAEWAKQKAGELAVAKLAAIRDGFPKPADAAAPADPAAPKPVANPVVDAEAFAKAVEAAGLKVERRDWADRQPPKNPDPSAKTPTSEFFQGAFQVYTLKDGEVAAPELDRDRAHAFLVRSGGSREPSEVKIRPDEYEMLSQRAANTAAQNFAKAAFDLKAYVALYGLKVKGLEKDGIPQP